MKNREIITEHIELKIEALDLTIRDTNPYTKEMQTAVANAVILKKWYEGILNNVCHNCLKTHLRILSGG